MGGICTALAVIFMFGASFVPGIELTLFLISSLFTAVMVIEAGVAGGLSVFAAASLLGLILIPNKLALIPYVFCFGYYAVLKYYIEKIKSGVSAAGPQGLLLRRCFVYWFVLLQVGSHVRHPHA